MRNRVRVVHARLRIAHANFERLEKWMESNVPPDFFRVIDAAGFDQELAVIFVLGKTFECVWNPSARKTLEHFESITFQAGVLADPERRVGRERVNVREKIARLIHDVNRALPIRNADVHGQTADELGPSYLLHALDNHLIPTAWRCTLIAPVRKRMRAH